MWVISVKDDGSSSFGGKHMGATSGARNGQFNMS